MEILEGSLSDEVTGKIGIVVSRWNSFVTKQLLEGARAALVQHNVKENQLVVSYCPGSYEIPLTAQKLAAQDDIAGVIALGAVIRGETPHFKYICEAVNNGIAELNRTYGKPVAFGILTTDTVKQAIERAGMKSGNKGEEAAFALLEMLSLVRKIDNR